MVYERGDICLVDFNPAKGGEIGKLRPAIMLSTKEEHTLLETVIIIPLSTYIETNSLPYRYHIKKRENLNFDSDACIYEIRALSKTRVKKRVASLLDDELKIIQKALCQLLT